MSLRPTSMEEADQKCGDDYFVAVAADFHQR
jgi:hypothetical protein